MGLADPVLQGMSRDSAVASKSGGDLIERERWALSACRYNAR
jgi:hypothetical protein